MACQPRRGVRRNLTPGADPGNAGGRTSFATRPVAIGNGCASIRDVRFRDLVAGEFRRRRHLNPRYSLRGFARALGTHHATLSRLLAGAQPVQDKTIRTLGPRLGLSRGEIAAMISREDAAAVVSGIARPTFRPDCRWLAMVTGISVDRVNIALALLLRTGRLRMPSASQWLVTQS